jgi:hypothetical protein
MKRKWTIFKDWNKHKWLWFSNDTSKANKIYKNDTWLQAGLFALNTLMMSYLTLVKIRKEIFLKNVYGKSLILFTHC